MTIGRLGRLMIILGVIAVSAVGGYFGGVFGAGKLHEAQFNRERRDKTQSVLARMNPAVRKGAALPDGQFVDAAGNAARLGDLVRRRTVVSFMRSPCGNCEHELWNMAQASLDSMAQQSLVLICDVGAGDLDALRNKYKLHCPVLYDSGGAYRNWLGAFSFPFNIIVDDSLVIQDIVAGYIREGEFRELGGMNGID